MLSVASFWLTSQIINAEATETQVTVTEQIPWMNCTKNKWPSEKPEDRKYTCTVKWDFSAFMWFVKWFVKYVTLIWVLSWVLMLVVSWINLSISWDKKKAKDKFKQVIMALLVVLFMGFILNSVAPWIYK